MRNVLRFDLVMDAVVKSDSVNMVESEKGDWVHFDTVKSLMASYEKEIEMLKKNVHLEVASLVWSGDHVHQEGYDPTDTMNLMYMCSALPDGKYDAGCNAHGFYVGDFFDMDDAKAACQVHFTKLQLRKVKVKTD
jgi:hypothetical protein